MASYLRLHIYYNYIYSLDVRIWQGKDADLAVPGGVEVMDHVDTVCGPEWRPK